MHNLPPDSMAEQPLLLDQCIELVGYMRSLSSTEIQQCMQVSEKMVPHIQGMYEHWSPGGGQATCAIDTFAGDIYSGLQTHTWSNATRHYAATNLYILSGLYGLLRPLDAVMPYRLEMGYRLPHEPYRNLYHFWADRIASLLEPDETYINLAAIEYSKSITPYLPQARFISPKFLTISPKTHEPTFVVVHAKIARGAFAHWMLKEQVADEQKLQHFTELGYRYDAAMSTPDQPVFICKEFQGLGLSVRLRASKA